MFETTSDFVWQKIQPRPRDAHKGTFGSVLAVAGSASYRGAAALAVEGALRTGAGIVTLASVEPVLAAVAARLPECCFCPCEAGAEDGISPQNIDRIRRQKASVLLAGGEEIGSDFTLTVAGARPQGWLAGLGLRQERGFLVTDAMLRTSDPLVFAAGDCATVEGAARPKAGVFAVRAAPVLHANLRAALTGQALRPFRPQRDYLKLVALGGKAAVADKWGLAVSGPRLWRLKDRIDREFMERLSDLPGMTRPAVPTVATKGLAQHLAQRPLCGGCGAKLGPV